MAALCTGNYGLSQNCTDNSKEYYFVKLTDSAYRAIEDYQRNQNKYNTHATIQIVGNGGHISFPSPGGNAGSQFRFSIDEIEGSFECIQQTQNQLDVLGALPYKMRIHANDDVYETTRHRMAVAEENQKNKCTREIKPNQTDIGRKVKLKNSSNRLPNIPPKRDQLLTSTSQSPLPASTSSTSLNAVSSTQLLTGPASTLNIGSTATTANTISSTSALSSSNSIGSSVTGSTPNQSVTNSAFSPLNTINSNSSNNSLKNSNNLTTNSSFNSITNNNSNSSSSSLKHHQNYNSTSSSANLTGVSSASSLSSALSSAAVSGTSGIGSSYYSNNSNSGGLRASNGVGNNSINNGGSRRGTSGNSINNRNQRNGSRHMPDITKKKIRERLIHLLALKPYKKPELYTRLQNEGIREREKSTISTILKEISIIRDNTYNLKRQIWNDVNEDWPFYTEQELQMLKRRKPQNLTPPLSSDGGSSTSGQSPTSTHNGSPPPAVKRPSLDRFYEEPTAKKQRISHFRKDNNEINSSNTTVPTRHNQDPEDNAMSISYSVLGSEAARRISPRDEATNGHSNISNNMNSNNSMISNNSHHHNIPNSHHHNANITNNNNSSNNKNNSNNTTMNNNSGNAHHKSPKPPYSHPNSNNINNSINNVNISRDNGNCIDNNSQRQQCPSPMTIGSQQQNLGISGGNSVSGGGSGGVIGASSPGAGPPRTISNNPIAISGLHERGGTAINNNSSNINNHHNHHHGSNSSDSYNPGGPLTNNSYDFSRFTSIRSVEQRRQYKTEFENDYDEYRQLLNQMETVGKKFNVLAQQLNNAKNNKESYKVIRKKILNEYEKINRDQEHQRVKARFDYLHAKLAHIKKLVHEFDQTITAPRGGSSSGGIGDLSSSEMNSGGNIGRISSPIQNVGGTVHNGTNNSNKNGAKLRSSPIGNISSGANMHHLPKQENY